MALYELEEFQGPKFLGFVRNIPTPAPYIGSTFLPDRQVDDLSFEYVIGTNDQPAMASIIGWDSEAPVEGRPPLGERIVGELPPIKRKAQISEKELIRFLQPRAGSADKQAAINSVYDITGRLLDSVQARVEWLRMQALSEDQIVYSENGIIFSFDYGVNTAYQIDVNTATGYSVNWSDHANSNPVTDLQLICNTVEDDTGFRPATMVCSRVVVDHMLQNDNIRLLVRGSTTAPLALLNEEELNRVLRLYGLPNIVAYDAKVSTEAANGTKTQSRAMAQNKVVLLPGPEVTFGNTLWGPTAEATRALVGTTSASRAPGIYAVTYGVAEPPSEWVKAVGVAFPSIPGIDFLVQLDVL